LGFLLTGCNEKEVFGPLVPCKEDKCVCIGVMACDLGTQHNINNPPNVWKLQPQGYYGPLRQFDNQEYSFGADNIGGGPRSLTIGYEIGPSKENYMVAINKISVGCGPHSCEPWGITIDVASFAKDCTDESPCLATVENGTLYVRPANGQQVSHDE